MSFPSSSPTKLSSINSYIHSNDFPSFYGTFLTVVLLIRDLPKGSQALTRDVRDAYRTVPLHASQWPGTVLRGPDDNQFFINTANCFGLSSAGGVWGQVADTICTLFRLEGLGPVTKWVDDFLFFRIPNSALSQYNKQRRALAPLLSLHQTHSCSLFLGPILPDGTQSEFDEDFSASFRVFSSTEYFTYSEKHLDTFSQYLGLPWKVEKSTNFSSSVLYLGFIWNLDLHSITLPTSKQQKYLSSIQNWCAATFHSLNELQRLYGQLLHVCLLIPRGRAYLASLEKQLSIYNKRPHCQHRSSKQILVDLQWWLTLFEQGKLSTPLPSFESFPSLQAYADASLGSGLGIVFNQFYASFAYNKNFLAQDYDIAWAEGLAVFTLLHYLQLHLPRHFRFAIFCDNQVVTSCFKLGRSRNFHLNELLKDIYYLLHINQWDIQINYIPSHSNPADKPSRGLPASGTSICNFSLPPSLSAFIHQCPSAYLQNSTSKPFSSLTSDTAAIPTPITSNFELFSLNSND